MMDDIKLQLGQIWKERDNRSARYVVVREFLDNGKVKISTCDQSGQFLGRNTKASISRFNGKYGGYEYIGDEK